MNKDAIAISRIKKASEIAQARGMGPLYVGYSGGKDSTVLADLAIRAAGPLNVAHTVTQQYGTGGGEYTNGGT